MRVASRQVLALVGALACAVVAGLLAAAPAVAADRADRVVICHRTTSPTNPYDQVVVSRASAVTGHAVHRGPVFEPGLDSWGDIIPPIRPGLPLGRNWPAGEAVLDNGCEVEPDVGPLPSATVGDVVCTGPDAGVEVAVSNDADATRPAFFAIAVDGDVVRRVGPVAPGASETVVLDAALAGLEDQTVTIEVRSGGEVVAARVVTIDCAPPPPGTAITADLACVGQVPQGSITATNSGEAAIEVSATVDGAPVGAPVTVPPGETVTATADLSAFEDQTVTVAVLVDGEVVATYTATPDCVPPQPAPRVAVGATECPPPLATVTLANDGDPDSSVVYAIRVDGTPVQESAPIYGGDATTIVVDLSAYEDRTVAVALLANGTVLGRRVLSVDCERPATEPAVAVPTSVPSGVGPPARPGSSVPLLGLAGYVLLGVAAVARVSTRRGRSRG